MRTLRPPPRLLLVAALATLLFAGALRAFFSSVYYHNLTSLGLNATALFALALLAPLLYAAPRLLQRPRRVLLGAALLLVAGRVGMSLTRGTLLHLAFAGLAAASFLVLLPALLRSARGESGDDGPVMLATGVALGWAADAGLLLAFGSFDRTATPWGLVAVVPLGAALLWLAWMGRPVDAWPGRDRLPPRWRLALAGLALGAWLYLLHAVLGAPHAVARWGPHPLWAAALGTLAGLAGAAVLLARPVPRWRLVLPALNALALLALLDHGFLHSPLAPLLLAFAHAALVVDLAVLAAFLGRATLRQAGLATAWGTLALLLLHFASAFALTFAYVPLGDFWQGKERVLPALAFLLVAAGTLAAGADARDGPRPRAAPRRLAVGLALALLVLPMGALAVPAAEVEPPAEGAPLRVLAFNLHQAFSNAGAVDPDLFVDLLRAQDADVVALQESDTARFTSANVDLLHILARRLGYHAYAGPPTHAQSFGVALLSRLPIEEASHHRLPSGSDNRYYVEARLDWHGEDVWVYVVHLALPQEDRVSQTDALLARASTRPSRILAGDFNSCPEGICPGYEGPPDDVYARVTADHRDGWVQATGRNASDPAARTYDAAAPRERIDYVFVSPDLAVTRYETVRTPDAVAASDHLPVLAEVTRPSP